MFTDRKNIAYCQAGIDSLILANVSLTHTNVGILNGKTMYGKSDTKRFDADAENAVRDCVLSFDSRAALITEELGQSLLRWPPFTDLENHPAVFFCDPADRSDFLVKYLDCLVGGGHENERFGEFVGAEHQQSWEAIGDGPASVTGACAGITCVRQGQAIFSVLLNYITQELTVACPDGVRLLKLCHYNELKSRGVTYKEVMEDGQEIQFPPLSSKAPWDDLKYFTCFMGNERKKVYVENLRDSGILSPEDRNKFARHQQPGGPCRILYLSSLQPKDLPMGFILANGEKITEWIHWLPFARFSSQGNGKSLKIFEVSHDQPWTKDGILMSTSEPYSVFQEFNGQLCLDVNFLRRIENPSKYRSTLIVTYSNNDLISLEARSHCYRQILFA